MTSADLPVRDDPADPTATHDDGGGHAVDESYVPPEREPIRGTATRHRLVTSRADGAWVLDVDGIRYRLSFDDACRLADQLAVEVVEAMAPATGAVADVRIGDERTTLTLLSPAASREIDLSGDLMDVVAPIFLTPSAEGDGWLPTEFEARFDGCAAAWLHFYLPELEGSDTKHYRFHHAGREIAAGELVRGDETMIEVPADVLDSPHPVTVLIDVSEPTAPDDGRSLGVILSAVSRTTTLVAV